MGYEAGRHKVKVADYGMKSTNDGLPQIYITFKNEESGLITWFGTLKEGKGREITLKSIIIAGFTGNDIAVIAKGPEANVMDMEKELSIVTESEYYNGKDTMKVKWVNEASMGIQNRLSHIEAVEKVRGYDLGGELMMLRREMQEGRPQTKKPHVNTTPDFAADDIPF